MSHDQNPKPNKRTRLLRAAADGELLGEQESELQAHLEQHPEDQAVVDFERLLRSQLEATFGNEGLGPSSKQTGPKQAPQITAPRTRLRLAPLLAAAALLLVTVYGLRGLFEPSPDEAPGPVSAQGGAKLVEFLQTHQEVCPISVAMAIEGYRMQPLGEALRELDLCLSQSTVLTDVNPNGFMFVGMSTCGIPGEGTSMHLQFMGLPKGKFEGVPVSLYIQADNGPLPIEEGATYALKPKHGGTPAQAMFVWKSSGLCTFVVTPDADAAWALLGQARAPKRVLLL